MARGRPSTSTIGFLAVVAMAALGGWILVTRTVLPALDTMRFGFPVYYTSSRLVVEGEWSPDVYDNAWFFARSLELTDDRIGEIYRPNTPVASLLAIPIASLDIETARRIWLVADLALIVGHHRCPHRRPPGPSVTTPDRWPSSPCACRGRH